MLCDSFMGDTIILLAKICTFVFYKIFKSLQHENNNNNNDNNNEINKNNTFSPFIEIEKVMFLFLYFDSKESRLDSNPTFSGLKLYIPLFRVEVGYYIPVTFKSHWSSWIIVINQKCLMFLSLNVISLMENDVLIFRIEETTKSKGITKNLNISSIFL